MSKKPKKPKEVIRFGNKEVKVSEKEETSFNKLIKEEVEKEEKLPIDKLVKIADKAGLLNKEQTPEEKWDSFIKGIKLHDIVYDCMQSSLNEFCKKHNKVNEDNLSMKLYLRKEAKKGQIFGVKLVLEMRRFGAYKVILSKFVGFTHVREVREEAAWKYALYGNMYNSLMEISMSHLLMLDDVNTNRIEPKVS